ncbi:MAG: hypothetical protein HFF77_01380 [Oscillospiraceae bacterium]|jgi:hypothetical protein|nr:hypothetical protein [Oscillospiraceae bacterium]
MQLKGIKKRKWDRSTWISGTIDLFLTPEAVIDLHKNILEQFSEIAIGEKRRRSTLPNRSVPDVQAKREQRSQYQYGQTV